MCRPSISRKIVLAVAGGLLLSTSAVTHAAAAQIKVLTSVALTAALNELAPKFEESGDKVDIGYSLIADIRKRMLAGETADVVILCDR
jgi:molybdate transport system substrate-binding protein